MTYKIKLNRMSPMQICDVRNEENEMLYTVKNEGLFNPSYGVYHDDIQIANIDCNVTKDHVGDKEHTYIYVSLYRNDEEIASINSTFHMITKETYGIDGFDYKISSNLLGTYYKITDRDNNKIAEVDSKVMASDYVLNVYQHNEEDVLLAFLMIIIYKVNDPDNSMNNIMDAMIGNSFKMD